MSLYATVAELADARDLKSLGGDVVRVRFPSVAPYILKYSKDFINKYKILRILFFY